MTDLIDLATLAGLGQHFSSHEDVAQLKGALSNVQNDLALIKNFLLHQFGAEFSSSLNNNETSLEQGIPFRKKGLTTAEKAKGPSSKRIPSVTGCTVTTEKKDTKESSNVQHRPRPPPLQRFFTISSVGEDDGGNSLRGSVINVNTSKSTSPIAQSPPTSSSTIKSEKFRRNFLSMNSLKSSGGNGGVSSGTNQSRLQRISTFGEKCTSLKILDKAINGRSIKMESGGNSNVPINEMKRNGSSGVMCPSTEEVHNNEVEDDEFNVSEDAYAAVVVSDGNYGEAGEDDYGYAAYEEADYQDGDYDDSITQMVYQEDDETIYEDFYPMEGLEITDADGATVEVNPNRSSSQRLTNGRRNTAAVSVKKAHQRRLSLPATVTSDGLTDNSGGVGGCAGDPNFMKKCKVCHEEVPSYSLFNHVVSSHYKGEVPTCSICKKTFTYKQGLISHMRYHDAEKYDKACSYCGKKFIRRSDVIIHERRLHTGERPFQCPVPDCNQGFVRRYCLLTHVKTNHGEPYMSKIVRGEAIS